MNDNKSSHTLNDKEFVDQLYFNVTRENVQNISEQQFQIILQEVLRKHLELSRQKIANANFFTTTGNYICQNNACKLF